MNAHSEQNDTQDKILIKDEACFVMARACELFAMDLAKRSELTLEDGKRARFVSTNESVISVWIILEVSVMHTAACQDET